MQATFLDLTSAIRPGYHTINTQGGLVQFFPGNGSTAGTLYLNGILAITYPTAALWNAAQTFFHVSLLNNQTVASQFQSPVMLVTGSPTGLLAGGAFQITGVNFPPALNAWIDVPNGASSLPVVNIGTVVVNSSTLATITLPAIAGSAGNYNVSLFNGTQMTWFVVALS